jgi:hypothetical protein
MGREHLPCPLTGSAEMWADSRIRGWNRVKCQRRSGWLWMIASGLRSARPSGTNREQRQRCEMCGLCKKDSPDFEVEIWAS